MIVWGQSYFGLPYLHLQGWMLLARASYWTDISYVTSQRVTTPFPNLSLLRTRIFVRLLVYHFPVTDPKPGHLKH
jgi:hypothetical protein